MLSSITTLRRRSLLQLHNSLRANNACRFARDSKPQWRGYGVPVGDICNYIIDNIDARLLRDLSRIVRAPRVHLDKKLFGAQTT